MISVVIPTLNAARHLARTLAPLVDGVAAGVVKQVIVADGGSTDATLAMADAAGCDVVTAEPMRAKQLRAGAEVAKAKWLLFLHADTALESRWVQEAERFIANPAMRKRAGAFRLAFDDVSPEAKRSLFWARLRGGVMKLPYGQQGLLISRFFYDGLGGYPDIAALEDVEMARRIGVKRWVMFDTEAMTSAANFRGAAHEKRGWRNLTLMARYWMGADPVELAKAYD